MKKHHRETGGHHFFFQVPELGQHLPDGVRLQQGQARPHCLHCQVLAPWPLSLFIRHLLDTQQPRDR